MTLILDVIAGAVIATSAAAWIIYMPRRRVYVACPCGYRGRFYAYSAAQRALTAHHGYCLGDAGTWPQPAATVAHSAPYARADKAA